MSSARIYDIDIGSVREIQSTQRNPNWTPAHHTTVGKVFIGVISTVLIGGLIATVAAPFLSATLKSPNENIQTTTVTSVTFTTTTATTMTTTSATTTTVTTTTSVTTTTTTVTTTSTTTTTTTTTSTTTASTTTATSTTTSTTTTTTTTTTVPPSTTCTSSTGSSLLYNNQFIYSPTLRAYAAGMLNNQFGVYNAYGYNNVTSTALWTAPQSSTPTGAFFAAQNDRNLVVYASNAAVLWTAAIHISGLQAAFCLQMLDNGNLIWADTSNNILWQTNTAVTG